MISSHPRLPFLPSLSALSAPVPGLALLAVLVLLVLAPALAAQDAAGAEPPASDDAPATGSEQTVLQVDVENLDQTIATLRDLRERGEAEPEQLALLGVLYLETGRTEESLEILEPMVRRQMEAGEPQPAVLYNAGRAATMLRQIDKAKQWLARAAELAPESPAGRELGMLQVQIGETEEGYRRLQEWVRRHPEDVDTRLAAAVVAFQLERPLDAGALLEGLPDQAPIRLLRGKFLLETGEPDQAIQTLEPMVDNHPRVMHGDLVRALSEAYLMVGRAPAAVELLEMETRTDPRTILLQAQAYDRTGQVDRGLAVLEPQVRVLLEAPADQMPANLAVLESLVTWSRLLTADGRAVEAIPALERATARWPDEAAAWQLLARALTAADRIDEARRASERFQELTSDTLTDAERAQEALDPAIRTRRRVTEALEEGNVDEALELARSEIRLAPDDPRPRFLEAQVLLAAQRFDEALEAAERLVQAGPGAADAWYLRGVVQLARQSYEAAESDLRQALELAPEHTPAMNDLAVLLMLEGENAEARQLLERVLTLQPEDPRARENLEELESRGS